MFAQIAQSVEQGTENPRVGSSILSLGTTRSHSVTDDFFFCCFWKPVIALTGPPVFKVCVILPLYFSRMHLVRTGGAFYVEGH